MSQWTDVFSCAYHDWFKLSVGINLLQDICHNICALPDWQHSNPAVQPVSWLCSQPGEVSDSGENPRWVPRKLLKRTLFLHVPCVPFHTFLFHWCGVRCLKPGRLGKGGWLTGLGGRCTVWCAHFWQRRHRWVAKWKPNGISQCCLGDSLFLPDKK